jgi:2-dehydropantoate 2-reductase
MRVCVVGAGAIGGLLGGKLALAGEELTLIARGPHLAAIRKQGLKLIAEDGAEHQIPNLAATDRIAEAGPHDLVILALKAHQIETIAPALAALFHGDTIVVTVQNGIPWWYFHKSGGEHEGTRLHSLDPHGIIEANIDAARIVGSIAYPAAEIREPGVVLHVEGNRFPIGELDGSKSERARMLSALFTKAGFKAPVLSDIRSQIWLKAWGNLSFNPISALTRATLAEIARFPDSRELAANMMREAQQVAEKLGISFRLSIEQRIAGAETVGDHKTSMLQDLEAGKPLEIEALVGVVLELAKLTNTPTPAIQAVYACTKLLSAAMERGPVAVQRKP